MSLMDRPVVDEGVTNAELKHHYADLGDEDIVHVLSTANSTCHAKLVKAGYMAKVGTKHKYTLLEEGWNAAEELRMTPLPPLPKERKAAKAPKERKASKATPEPEHAEPKAKAEDFGSTDNDDSDANSGDDVDTDEDAAKKMTVSDPWDLDAAATPAGAVMSPADVPPPDVPEPSKRSGVKVTFKKRPTGDVDEPSAKKPCLPAGKDAVDGKDADAGKDAGEDAVARAKEAYEKAIQDAKAAYEKAIQDATSKKRLAEELQALIADKDRKEAELEALIAELKAIAEKVAEKEAQLAA